MNSGFPSLLMLDSPLGTVDPRWKLAGLTSAGISVAFLRTLPPAVVALLLAWLLLVLGSIPLSWYVRRAAGLVLFVGLFVVWLPFISEGPVREFGPLQFSEVGLIQGGLVLAKALTIFTLMLVLWSTGPFESTLKAAHSLRLPGLLVQLLAMTYRYIFLLREEFRRLRIALRTRGFRNRVSLHSYRTLGHVAGSLLVRSHERAERVGQAMRCRGFDGRYRTLADFRTRPVDVAFFFAIVVSTLALLAWDLVTH